MNLELRKPGDQTPSLNDQMRNINEYFLAHSLYFDDADQATINKYVSALHVVRSAVADSGDADLQEAYTMTGSFDASKIMPLVKAREEMEKYRAILKEKAMKVASSV